jgi:hypothetical protein
MFCILIMSSSAQAQPWSLEQMKQVAFQGCLSQGGDQRFCSCYVNRWVGLWNQQDIYVWTQTGQATPHMQEMEGEAVRQCGG